MNGAIFKNALLALFTILMLHFIPAPHKTTEKHDVYLSQKMQAKIAQNSKWQIFLFAYAASRLRGKVL